VAESDPYCKKSEGERAKDGLRKREHDKEAAANDARVAAHKKGKQVEIRHDSSQTSSCLRSSSSKSDTGSNSD
jgi:hypothetical protein